jgi:hypothetical protein
MSINTLNNKDGRHRFPEMLAKEKSGERVEDRENSGYERADNQAQRGLAPHFGDIAGETDSGEYEKDANKKQNRGPQGNRFPEAVDGSHGRGATRRILSQRVRGQDVAMTSDGPKGQIEPRKARWLVAKLGRSPPAAGKRC